MTLAGNEDDITLLGQHTGCTDSFLAVYNTHYLLHLLSVETCQHIVDNILRFFKTWIIRGDNDLVTLLDGFLSHQRTLALVAIATGTTNGNDLSTFTIQHLMNGIKHILQGIGRMGIVYNSSHSFL